MSRRWKGPVTVVTNPRFEQGSPEHEEYKEKQRKYYYDTVDVQRSRAKERMRRKRERNQQWVVNQVAGKACECCGTSDTRVLAFDHIDGSEKHGNIADMVSRGAPLNKLIEETMKCRLLCHNCHMLRTFEHMGGTYHSRVHPCTAEEFVTRFKDVL